MSNKVLSKENKKEFVVSLNDWHVPHEAGRVVDLEIEFCRYLQPDIIVLHELHDFYAVSKYDKDPSRLANLQEEIDIVNQYLRRLRKYCPNTRLILINSNHLDRLRKYLWSKAPELNSLRALRIEELLELKSLDIEFRENFYYKKVLFKHGNVVRKFSGYSARGEFEKEGMSGCSGHTHRLSTYFHRSRGGTYAWLESGCACDLDAEYIEGVANWQHGFSVFSFDKDTNHFHPTVVPIVNYRLDWGDRTFIG